MKYKKSLYLPLLLLLFLLIGLLGIYGYSEYKKESERKLVQESFGWRFPVVGFPDVGEGDGSLLAYSSIRDPGGIAQGLPVRLLIPTIGVNTAIEDALITHDGKMDVPAGSINVAWFALGPSPGRVGSAVIGGHYGIDNGVPKVFYDLDKLKVDDIVQIINDKGETLSFIVRSKKSFDRYDDATTVFTSQDGLAHLNLITCEGVWNQVDDSYPQRLVVFTDAIPNPEVQEVTPSLPTTALPAETPQPSPTPVHSVITPSPTSTEASTPSTEITAPEPVEPVNSVVPTFTQDLTASTRVLFANSVDILVTTSLLVSISLLIFKIMRR